MRRSWTLLWLGLACCGSTPSPPAPAPDPPPTVAPVDAARVTIATDDEFMANGRVIVDRLVAIFTNDGQDCAKLAADITTLSADPIWAASTQYEDAHPDVRQRFAAEQAEMGKRFGAVARQASVTCAKDVAFAAALAKMR
jgi:hypothetical protein